MSDTAIALGFQQGVLMNETVVGETAEPVVEGLARYTGRWEFRPSGGAQP